jgi:hypothetical protein
MASDDLPCSITRSGDAARLRYLKRLSSILLCSIKGPLFLS